MKISLKTHTKTPFLLTALFAGLAISSGLKAQTFTTLHSFALEGFDTASSRITNSDGAAPRASLIISGNTLYGAAAVGSTNGSGTVFAVNTDGTGFTNLYVFTAVTGPYPQTNRDGDYPAGSLILSGNILYGMASGGGTNGTGTVFALNTNGTGFSILHTFTAMPGVYPAPTTNRDGAFPGAGLILSGTTLFGTAANGGFSGSGTVFALNIDGSGFTNLYSFTANPAPNYTNTDGEDPEAGLILSGSTLYGTARGGGSTGNGTVFAVNTNGTGFTNLYSFTANPAPNYTNTDGEDPEAGLILSGSTLYGTAFGGGNSDRGTVFALNTDGTGFTNLYNFTANPAPNYTNTDGIDPQASLVLAGNTLYGTASYGGSAISGTLFALNTNGTGFMPLHTFTARAGSNGTNSDGALPEAGLILAGNTLYGVASSGGNGGAGTVFSLSLAPQLAIMLSGTNVILTWPETGFNLQSTTNLAAPVWITVTGQNAVTNPLSGAQKFYRLSQ